MLILRITTRDPLQVVRKYESKRARMLAVTSGEQSYSMLYVMDEVDDIE